MKLYLSPKMSGAVFLMLLSLNGCGTFDTRGGDVSFGGYPYQAVGSDFSTLAQEREYPEAYAMMLLTLPFDFVLDTLFLPPDLVLWAMGREKDGFRFKP